MKLLSIMRHAKSSWDFPDLADDERPLIEKGIRRTEKTCRYIKSKNMEPDIIISSPAVRAMETARLVKNNLKMDAPILVAEAFYPGNMEYYFTNLKMADEKYQHIMIIGHNPEISNFACELLKNNIAAWIPTSGCVTMQLDIKGWDDLLPGKGQLVHYIEPKKL
jgi:phosphohistidine phosphatase